LEKRKTPASARNYTPDDTFHSIVTLLYVPKKIRYLALKPRRFFL
jgi:hypothetical protein